MSDTDGSAEGTEKRGTFLVTAVDDASAVLKDVNDGQVHALSSNPGVEADEAVEGVVATDPPLDVTWQLVEVERRWAIAVEESDQSPTAQVRETAAAQGTGDLTRLERAGEGEIHVITVPEEATEEAVADVLSGDETTLARAARLGASRVEVRSEPGTVSVRYLP